MIRCDTCPRSKDVYPGKVDSSGYHYHICGLTGNIVYPTPYKIKRASRSGYLSFSVSSCGLYEDIEDALNHMTESEVRRWREKNEQTD